MDNDPAKTDLKQLDAAIRCVLGNQVYEALTVGPSGARTTAHRMAVEKAFAYSMAGPEVEVIRASLIRLKQVGEY